MIGDDLAVHFIDGVLHDIGHDRLAVHLLQMRHGHLAGTEAIDAGLGLHLVELAVKAAGEIASGQHDFISALEAFGEGFGDLHRSNLFCAARPEVRNWREFLS